MKKQILAFLLIAVTLMSAITLVGEIGAFEVVKRGLLTVADAFIQRACDPVQPLVQLLTGIRLVAVC